MRRTAKGIAVLASATLALALVACGGDDKASEEKPKADPAALKADLTWWDTSDPKNEGPAYQELIAKFNQTYPNVKINYQSVPFGEAQNKFKTAAQSGSGAPDVFRSEVAWTPGFAKLGYLQPIDGTPADLTAQGKSLDDRFHELTAA